MLKDKNIPLIRVGVVEPLVLAARKIGTPVDKVLRSLGLPVHMLEEPHMLVPEIPAWHFTRKICQIEGETLFGMKASIELAPQDFESVKPLLQGCSNLKGLLERIISIAPTQASFDRYELVEDGDLVWLLQKGPRLITDYVQVELFEVSGMIQMVQLVAGESWRPAETHFSFKCNHNNSSYIRDIKNSEHFNPGRIFFSKPYPGIAIPRYLLASKLPGQDDFQGVTDTDSYPLMPETISNRLISAIDPYIGERKLSEKLLTEITGMHFRTMQRKLVEENTSYSDILNQARFSKAQHLLSETDEKLQAISMMLGYKNASAFSRAFKCWAGVTPTEYRKQTRHFSQ